MLSTENGCSEDMAVVTGQTESCKRVVAWFPGIISLPRVIVFRDKVLVGDEEKEGCTL